MKVNEFSKYCGNCLSRACHYKLWLFSLIAVFLGNHLQCVFFSNRTQASLYLCFNFALYSFM